MEIDIRPSSAHHIYSLSLPTLVPIKPDRHWHSKFHLRHHTPAAQNEAVIGPIWCNFPHRGTITALRHQKQTKQKRVLLL
jgi:hypothetical protein